MDFPAHVGPGGSWLWHPSGWLIVAGTSADGAGAVVVHPEEVDGRSYAGKIAVVARRHEVLPLLEDVRRVLAPEQRI